MLCMQNSSWPGEGGEATHFQRRAHAGHIAGGVKGVVDAPCGKLHQVLARRRGDRRVKAGPAAGVTARLPVGRAWPAPSG
jgi:hypothetical protein